ncbi:MAG: hypothetical protein Q8Q08_05025 [Candidatus Omnitrophota bacterium]|nr:hypothetical protein [Candidatus Omnitrophota bacterium]MDZ4243128.1 hypothetical protein [Candidatus Omnitrophota bacterium]
MMRHYAGHRSANHVLDKHFNHIRSVMNRTQSVPLISAKRNLRRQFDQPVLPFSSAVSSGESPKTLRLKHPQCPLIIPVKRRNERGGKTIPERLPHKPRPLPNVLPLGFQRPGDPEFIFYSRAGRMVQMPPAMLNDIQQARCFFFGAAQETDQPLVHFARDDGINNRDGMVSGQIKEKTKAFIQRPNIVIPDKNVPPHGFMFLFFEKTAILHLNIEK